MVHYQKIQLIYCVRANWGLLRIRSFLAVIVHGRFNILLQFMLKFLFCSVFLCVQRKYLVYPGISLEEYMARMLRIPLPTLDASPLGNVKLRNTPYLPETPVLKREFPWLPFKKFPFSGPLVNSPHGSPFPFLGHLYLAFLLFKSTRESWG